MEKVMVFIDGNNFYYGCKDTIGTSKIDFKKLIKFLIGGRELVKTYYYNVLLDKNKDLEKFDSKIILGLIEELQNITGFNIIQKISEEIDGVRISKEIIRFLEIHPHILDCMHIDISKYNELTFVTSEDKLGKLRSIYDKIMTDNKLSKQFS